MLQPDHDLPDLLWQYEVLVAQELLPRGPSCGYVGRDVLRANAPLKRRLVERWERLCADVGGTEAARRAPELLAILQSAASS